MPHVPAEHRRQVMRRRSLGLAALAAALVTLTTGCSSDEGAEAGPTTAAVTTTTVAASKGCAAPATPAPSGVQTIDVDGVARRYLISVPNGAAATPRPIVLDLHGFTATAEAQDGLTDMARVGTERGYVVVTPEAVVASVGTTKGPLWNFTAAYNGPDVNVGVETALPEGDDVVFLNDLVDRLEGEVCIDTDREYVTGMSAGAGMSTWLVCQPTQRFAAFAPVAGVTQGKSCPAATVPPAIIFHGDADPLVPYTGGDLVGFPLGIPGVEERAADFAKRDGCEAKPSVENIGADVVHSTWTCPKGGGLELYKVIGGGHTWPGSPTDTSATRTVDATALILDFFDAHHR